MSKSLPPSGQNIINAALNRDVTTMVKKTLIGLLQQQILVFYMKVAFALHTSTNKTSVSLQLTVTLG